MCKTYRAWVNQPSTLQPLHHLHGKKCIVVDEGLKDNFKKQPLVELLFTEGDTRAVMASPLCVSKC